MRARRQASCSWRSISSVVRGVRRLAGIAATQAMVGALVGLLLTLGGTGIAKAQATRIEIPSSASGIALSGRLHRPSAQSPLPAILLMHGCGGWQPSVLSALENYAAFFVRNGFVVLNLDSFGPRGNAGGTVCSSEQRLAQARSYRIRDAFDALAFLRGQVFVDPENIFLIGQSNGGSVAMLAATARSAPNFRAAVALYPWCGATGSRHVQLSAPLLILGGARDDWVPPRDCQRLSASGAELQIKIYEDAAHSFDLPIPVQTYLGKRVGFNPAAAADSLKEMVSFFRRHNSSGRETTVSR